MSAPSDPRRKYSSIVHDGPDRAPNRSMLRAVGFTDEDFSKPVVGVASTWSMVTPCNMHIDGLAREAAAGADAAGGKAIIFGTITVSDGISMGTPGMRYSMVSREVIADSIETVAGAEGFDAVVAIGGCDKNMPACVMALARLNRPSVFVYGGTILPGINPGTKKECDIVSVFEAVGQHAAHQLDDAGLHAVEVCSIPGAGSCGGMYTANTMAAAVEALGLSLPNSSAQLAIGAEKKEDCRRAGAAALALLAAGIRPRDILTRKALENAITVVIALGGSSNAVLHLLAGAHSANVKLGLDDFTRIGKRVPVLADLRPSGKYGMAHLVRIGGLPPLMKMLLDAGLLHGSCLTVTGRTVAENLQGVAPYPADQDIIRPLSNPLKPDSHLRILYGNLAPAGAVAKISGKEGLVFSGRAIVFEGEEAALHGDPRRPGQGRPRHRHPQRGTEGRSGHEGNARPDQCHHGQGPGQRCRADYRRPFLRRHARIRRWPYHARGGHRRPDRHHQERRSHHDRRDQERTHPRPAREGDQGPAQGVEAQTVQGNPRRAREIRQTRVQRLRRRRDRQIPMSWNRFKETFYQDRRLGLALDISRIPFPDDFLAKMEPAMQQALADMAALEKGAIANPDEKRMVGHYWLRAPAGAQ